MISIPDNYMSEGDAEFILSLFPDTYKGIFIDVGAYSSLYNSNSYLLELHGWDVFCLEPNPTCKNKLLGKNVFNFAAGSKNEKKLFHVYSNYDEQEGTGFVFYPDKILKEIIQVDTVTLDFFIEKIIDKKHIDVLSIDTEGWEMEVLKGIDLEKWNVNIICIENIFDYSEQNYYIISNGFEKIKRIGYNNIYRRVS